MKNYTPTVGELKMVNSLCLLVIYVSQSNLPSTQTHRVLRSVLICWAIASQKSTIIGGSSAAVSELANHFSLRKTKLSTEKSVDLWLLFVVLSCVRAPLTRTVVAPRAVFVVKAVRAVLNLPFASWSVARNVRRCSFAHVNFLLVYRFTFAVLSHP